MLAWTQELRPTLALALPIMIGQLSQMLMGVTDSVMIGHVGTVELAGAAFAGAVFGFVYIGAIGLLQPGSVLVARERGAGREDLCGAWQRHARAVAWGAGLLLGAAMAATLPLAHHFGQPEEVVAVMGPYYLLIAVSLVPTLLFQADRQFAEAMGRPWPPLVIMLASVLLNVLLNWIFIHGKLGSPALGLTGAGVATLLARIVSVLVLRAWLARGADFQAAVRAARAAPLARARLREMLALGLPMGASLTFEGGAFSAAAVMAGWLGTVPLAAHQIAMSCAATAFMVPLGLSLALSVRTGQAVGAGRRERVRPMAVGAMLLTLGTAALATLVLLVAGERVADGFVKDDPAVVALAARVLVIVGVFQLVDGLQVVFAGALRGLTDVRVPLVATFVAYWVLALPGGYLLGVRGLGGVRGLAGGEGGGGSGGLEMIWISLAAGLALAAVALGWRLARLTRPDQTSGQKP